MNVFDGERGPLTDQQEAERLATLAEAGLTLEELRLLLRHEPYTSTVN